MNTAAFLVTRAISFHPPVLSVALYHCTLPSLEVNSIDFVLNGSIAVEYLGVDTGCTAETAVETVVVMAPVMAVWNYVSIASGIALAVVSSLLPTFVAASYGALLFACQDIIQP